MSDETRNDEAAVNDKTASNEGAMNDTSAAPEPIVAQAPAETPEEAARVRAAVLKSRDPGPAPRRAKPSGRATSDVGAVWTFALAVPFYGLAVLGAKLAPPQARAILLERGWPPHATMALACIAFAILLVKAFGLGRQRRAFRMDLLPEGTPRIGPEAATELVDHLRSMRDLRSSRSFLVERVLRVLSQYAAHGDVAEANAANEAEAEANAAAVAASFSTLKVLVWAMPILGLIGTVIGLSGAVGAFSSAMSGADQLDTIKDSLRQVTTGLAVAFDATFVALVASILVMLPMTWLQKAEDKLINDVDDYCVTNVLSRLGARVEPAAAQAPEKAQAAGIEAADVRRVVLEVLANPLGEMLTANARIMERLAQDRASLAGAQEAVMKQLAAFATVLEQAAPAMDRAGAEMGRATAMMGSSVERVATHLDRAAAQLGPNLERLTQGMDRAATQLERATSQMESRVAPSVERAAGQIERAAADLSTNVERAVTQLEVTTALAESATTAAERSQDQLSRELGASRQLLSLLAAGLGAGDASAPRPRHANGNGANGTHGMNGNHGANGTHGANAARGG